jgi:hypothetical protein
VGNLSTPRIYHTSTFLSQDNFVLIAGGQYGVSLITTETYIPSTGCFQTGLSMPRARYSHTADILPAFSDYILFSGGYGTSTIWNVSDLFNPITGDTLTLALTAARYEHASALFGSTNIALVGGIGASGNTLNTGDAMISGSTATFFAVTNTMVESLSDHTVTRLGNTSGVILIAGGRNVNTYYPYAELYYGASNVFISLGIGGTMSTARAFHTATYLPAFDQVLITGGCYDGWNYLNTMTLFDVATLSFTTLTSTMSTLRSWHTATLLSNGKVLIAGGNNNTIASASCDLVDPANNYLTTPAADLNIGRYRHTATLMPSNNGDTVLICGGTTNGNNVLDTCELYIV